VPAGTPLPGGGIYLANRFVVESPDGEAGEPEIPKYRNSLTGEEQVLEGGYALYRKNCLHCHGVSGDGDGPTAAFLWPKPRDFRQGLFKFTSTSGGAKPTRDDLRRSIARGIANSSMPSFEALMTPQQIQQVIDYVIFLSMRGQVEQGLILTASTFGVEEEAETFAEDYEYDIEDVVLGVQSQWEAAGSMVTDPPVSRVEPTRESLVRGRDLFLGRTTEKLQCASCHGDDAEGNGPSFVPPEVFYDVVFRGKSIEEYDDATQKLWVDGSLDAWGDPLRPANLNDGDRTAYKGGRRPLDIYWRITNGINGAKMPAHNFLKPEQIWDLVNFVLALPYQPELLENVPPPAGDGDAVASR
jgi:mono/diheme cytochrome c family protein